MNDEHPQSERHFARGITVPGAQVLSRLRFIKPGETVVYHVGKLPHDASYDGSNLNDQYRTIEAEPIEMQLILWIAETAEFKGLCKLMETRITDDISVYYAVGHYR